MHRACSRSVGRRQRIQTRLCFFVLLLLLEQQFDSFCVHDYFTLSCVAPLCAARSHAPENAGSTGRRQHPRVHPTISVTAILDAGMVSVEPGLHELELVGSQRVSLPVGVGLTHVARAPLPVSLRDVFAQRRRSTRDSRLAPLSIASFSQ